MLRLLTPCLLLLLGLNACQSARARVSEEAPEVACTLVVIRTGARTEPLSQAESSSYFGGHFDNMTRMAKAGDLLLAGPYGSQKSANDLRGIFLLNTADPEQARALAGTDPCFQAEIFRFEYHTLRTRFPLHACQAAVLARLDEAERNGKQLPPGSGCRNYVMVTVADYHRALVLATHPAVYLFAQLDNDRAIAFLDCQTHAQAEALLTPLMPQLRDVAIDEWFGTDLLAAMR